MRCPANRKGLTKQQDTACCDREFPITRVESIAYWNAGFAAVCARQPAIGAN
jgi:hypothetical protein